MCSLLAGVPFSEKTNIPVLEVRERVLLCSTHGTHIDLRLTIRLLGVDDPCLRQHMRILVLRKTDPAV